MLTKPATRTPVSPREIPSEEELEINLPDEETLKTARHQIQKDAVAEPKRFLEQTIVPEGGE